MVENKFKNKLYKLLKKDSRLWNEETKEFNETLLKDLIDKLDEKIIELLLGGKELKEKFFIKVKDARLPDGQVFVLKQNELKFFIDENKLDNSYTQYQNKIGLRVGNKLLSERDEVVLDWPFKDCVLEGGMTKEDQKRNEIFFNEVLAKDEIDRLFDPKALVNWKRYAAKGTSSAKALAVKEEKVKELKRDKDGTIRENLIIKGNNLIALHSLKEQFAGKVKLIYIDPPYNTGNDGFGYNDNYNHSAWLVFMKNRLEIAKQLLVENGSFWISLNDDEVHYAKILCDEIFGRDNFISTIIWHSKYTTSNDAKFVSYQHENILFYVKNKSQFEIGGFDRTDKQNQSYRNPDNDIKGVWKATPLHAKSGKEENNYTIEFPNGYKWTPPKGRYPRYSKSRLLEIYKENGLYFNKSGGVDKKTYLSEVKKSITPGSVWGYEEVGHTHANNEELANLLGKGIFDNPKGTYLIKKICKVGNVNDGDIILDYHAGSGTTAHAVLELNKEDGGSRQFILCEQMDYIKTVTKERVKKVIENNKTGDFIYFELAKWNEEAKEKILKAKSLSELEKLFDELYEKYFLNYNVKTKEFKEKTIKEEEFKKLGLDKQKKLFVEMLDMNQMYVNFSERADKKYKLSKEDIKLSEEFYSFC
ncbi:MAG: site-specific DNA-methyltransferase [Patescibacteria group bacterium]